MNDYGAEDDGDSGRLRGGRTPSQRAATSSLGVVAPLRLTIRFLSVPDVPLDIAEPHRMTVAGLKPLIRAQLMHLEVEAVKAARAARAARAEALARGEDGGPDTSAQPDVLRDAHRRRLRLIYSGKMLADDAILSRVLRPVAAPRPPRARGGSGGGSGRPGRPGQSGRSGRSGRSSTVSTSDRLPSAEAAARIYINCSMGDVQPDHELMAEVMAATTGLSLFGPAEDGRASTATLGGDSGNGTMVVQHDGTAATVVVPGSERGGTSRRLVWPLPGPRQAFLTATTATTATTPTATTPIPTPTATPTTSTTPAPRGFDRLLAAGFSAAEVNQLRLQFRSIQATRFTPDAMPSPDTLRAMEDRWLDNGGDGSNNNNNNNNSTATTSADVDTDGPLPPDEDAGMPGLLDVMVRAMLVGFVFPLGAVGWLAREHGLWTRKWQVFVSFGVVLSLVLGTVKTLAGEW